MIAAFPFCAADVQAARNLFKWIELLGGCQNHSALLVPDNGVNWHEFMELRGLAEKSFKKVFLTVPEKQVSGWPQGPNAMFRAAAEAVEKDLHEPFFFCEPDCIPLVPGWLDSIEGAYRICGKAFMGALVPGDVPSLPRISLAGNAIYPADSASRLRAALDAQSARAWDVASAEVAVPESAHSHLIQHFWGQPQLPPTFSERKYPDSPVNTFTLQNLHPDAVVFHRNKDGTLMRILHKLRFPGQVNSEILGNELSMVFPFCGKDEGLMVKSMSWIARISGKISRTAVLHHDGSVSQGNLNEIKRFASDVFGRVLESEYPNPKHPFIGWPGACNWAFRMACEFAETRSIGPWFWFESDAVAIKPDWFIQVEREYFESGMPFMGTVFPGNTHMNGVGIYPENARSYAPCVWLVSDKAWDFHCGPQIVPHAHNASHLIQHFDNGRELGPPVFNASNLGFISRTSVVYHSVKNHSLIDLLSSQHA